MCQFSHLMLYENCTLETKSIICLDCGAENPSNIYDAQYIGHSEEGDTVMDVFELKSIATCKNCGKNFTSYQEFCRDWCFSTENAFSRVAIKK